MDTQPAAPYSVKIIENVALIESNVPFLTDAQSALDLIASIGYHYDLHKIAVSATCLPTDFFKLSTGLLGEIAQKFVNYHCRLAIIGDFSQTKSKPLRDYMYESNRGNTLFFVKDETDALEKLR